MSSPSEFQSAPRSCDRSDIASAGSLDRAEVFQSAPRSCDRSDRRQVKPFRRDTGFNPRPGRVTGATRQPDDLRRRQLVSIRAPVV